MKVAFLHLDLGIGGAESLIGELSSRQIKIEFNDKLIKLSSFYLVFRFFLHFKSRN